MNHSRHLLHSATLLLLIALIAGPALASPQAGDEARAQKALGKIEEDAKESIYFNGVQSAPNPWTVSNSAALFDRPTLGNSVDFKVAATDSGGPSYELSLVPSQLAPEVPVLDGLQLTGNYTPGIGVYGLGLKWNLSFRNVGSFLEGLSREERERIQADYEDCSSHATSTNLSEADFEAALRSCAQQEADAFDKLIRSKPMFSIGAGAAYNSPASRWGRFTANASMELPILTLTRKGERKELAPDLSLILNGGFESDLQQDGRRTSSLGGTAALTWVPTLKVLNSQLQVSLAGKLSSCLHRCGENPLSISFGPSLSYAISKSTRVGLDLSWGGAGRTVRDALLGLSFSQSLGPI